MNLNPISFIALSALLIGCHGRSKKLGEQDPYTPKLQIVETNPFSGKPGVAYRFTEEQLARMSRTKLETNRFVSYVNRRWPIERLQAYCVPLNQRPELWQNLVSKNTVLQMDLYKAESTGFDRVWVYVDQDDGKNTYFEEAGRNWRRWTYSLNVRKGARDWVIIEELPKDFMDSTE
jgi:hypothetical protein